MILIADSITHKKLVLIKQLYRHTELGSASRQDTVGRILSVIGFDLAVETVLNAILVSLDPSAERTGDKQKDERNFHNLLTRCEELVKNAGGRGLQDKRKIKHVHDIRNDAQHRVKYPTENEVNDCRTYVRDFLNQIISEVWGLQFEKISVADLIQHEGVRGLLCEAAAALAADEYQKVAEKAIAAFNWTIDRVSRSVIAGTIYSGKSPLIPTIERDTSESLVRMQEVLLAVALRLSLSDYARYTRLVKELRIGVFNLKARSEPFVVYGEPRRDATVSDAEFLLAYVSDSILQIEDVVGDLDSPFGN